MCGRSRLLSQFIGRLNHFLTGSTMLGERRGKEKQFGKRCVWLNSGWEWEKGMGIERREEEALWNIYRRLWNWCKEFNSSASCAALWHTAASRMVRCQPASRHITRKEVAGGLVLAWIPWTPAWKYDGGLVGVGWGGWESWPSHWVTQPIRSSARSRGRWSEQVRKHQNIKGYAKVWR